MVPYIRRYISLTFSLGLVLGLSIYFRAFPIFLPQFKNQAKGTVEQEIRNEITQDIDKRFSEYDNLMKVGLVDRAVADYKRNKKSEIKNRIKLEYLKLKDRYQDTNGQTYLMELDCWHWARYVNNVYRLGRTGDRITNGKEMDTFMLAPFGSAIPWNRFLFYLSTWLYKLFLIISPVPLFNFVFYLPLFFFTVFIILLYLFCYHRWGNLGAVISSLFVGLAPIFLYRSCAGWFDTDIFNLLFPLLICWTYIKTYAGRSLSSRVLWICFSAFWVGLFSFTWLNWWFIFLIVIIYEIYSIITLPILYLLYKDKNLLSVKQHIFSLLLFVSSSLLWIIIFSGLEPIKALYPQLTDALSLNAPFSASIWPNVLATVGELGKTDFTQIGETIGNPYLFITSLIFLLMLFYRTLRNSLYTGFKREFIIILTFWFICMYVATFKGIRFNMFLLIPLGLSLGWVISDCYRYFRVNKKWLSFILLAAIIILGLEVFNRADKTAKEVLPNMNDTWYKTLVTIKQKTPESAVINSWWDFGDWFKVVAGRRVIFDGQSQNLPQAYWMAKVLMSGNEEEAIGILRMLNNAGNRAFDIINERLGDPLASVLLLKRIILSEPKKAKEELLKFLPLPLAEEVAKILFTKPGSAYFIVDYAMQNKMPAISFLGNWDFAKAYISKKSKNKDRNQTIDYLEKLGIDAKKTGRFFQEAGSIPAQDLEKWVSPKLIFHSRLSKGKDKNGTVLFDNGLVYNPQEKSAYLYSGAEKGYRIPKSLFIFKEDKLEEVVYPKNDLDFSALVFTPLESPVPLQRGFLTGFTDKGEYRAVLLDPELARSMFVHLYFLGAKSLKHFKPFIAGNDGDDYIRIYEIIWD